MTVWLAKNNSQLMIKSLISFGPCLSSTGISGGQMAKREEL